MQQINNKLSSWMKNNPVPAKHISLLISRVHVINKNTTTSARSKSDTAADAASKIPAKIQTERNIAQIYKYWSKQFAKAGISETEQSVQYILMHIFNLNKVLIILYSLNDYIQSEKISDLYRKFSSRVDIQTQNQIEILCKKRLLKYDLILLKI